MKTSIKIHENKEQNIPEKTFQFFHQCHKILTTTYTLTGDNQMNRNTSHHCFC